MKDIRIGMGFDVHELVFDRKLIIGGVLIDYERGLMGHSDADVLLHAIMDSMLGALALGDIGKHFPDTDDKYKGIDSRKLLRYVYDIISKKGYKISNIDTTIVAQAPKLSPYIDQMRENIANDLFIDIDKISIKATTTEHLGYEGRGEGISAYSNIILIKD